jgi:hypothetical protein
MAIDEEDSAATIALHWAGQLATLQAQERAIAMQAERIQKYHFDAVESLVHCRLTRVAQSEQHAQGDSKVHVDEDDEVMRD